MAHKSVYHANLNYNKNHDAILEVACSKDQLAAFVRQARRCDSNVSNWARHILLKALPKRKKGDTNV